MNMDIAKDKKECRTCGSIKPLSEYYKGQIGKYVCKRCLCEKTRLYALANKDKIKEYHKKYVEENKHLVQKYQTEYWHKNKKAIKEKRKTSDYQAKYWLKNKQRLTEQRNKIKQQALEIVK